MTTCLVLLLGFRVHPVCSQLRNMAKTKQATRGSCRKLKELMDQVDGLVEEVREIESEFSYFHWDASELLEYLLSRGGRVK